MAFRYALAYQLWKRRFGEESKGYTRNYPEISCATLVFHSA